MIYKIFYLIYKLFKVGGYSSEIDNVFHFNQANVDFVTLLQIYIQDDDHFMLVNKMKNTLHMKCLINTTFILSI